MNGLVRQLTEADAEAFRAIRLEALADSPDAFGGDLAEESRQGLEAFTRQITQSAIFGAFTGDDLRGVVGLFWNDSAKRRHLGHLYTVYASGARHRDRIAAHRSGPGPCARTRPRPGAPGRGHP